LGLPRNEHPASASASANASIPLPLLMKMNSGSVESIIPQLAGG
jgi:hypothetical protein